MLLHFNTVVLWVLILLAVGTSAGPAGGICGCLSSVSTLMELFNATNGDNWTNKVGWTLSPSDCSILWHGVTCDGGFISSIDLGTNNLVGTLPASLASLVSLRSLFLHNNAISGTLPLQWSGMTSLSILALYNNQLTGTLPAWTNWGSLTDLELHQNSLSGSLPLWGGLGLTTLFLFSNRLNGTLPPEWGSSLALVINLQLHFNSFTGGLPKQWSAMSNVVYINLYDNTLTGTLPPEWSALTTLESLYLKGNYLTGRLPDEWSGMASMKDLQLNYNSLTGTLPSSWASMASLSLLMLHVNQLNGTLPPQWGTALTALTNLQIGMNSIEGALPDAWGGMAALGTLFLEDNKLQGTLPRNWSAMVSLSSVRLNSNRLKGSLPAEWGTGMRVLTSLDVGTNCLSGIIPSSLVHAVTNANNTKLQGVPKLIGGAWPQYCYWIVSHSGTDTHSTTASRNRVATTSTNVTLSTTVGSHTQSSLRLTWGVTLSASRKGLTKSFAAPESSSMSLTASKQSSASGTHALRLTCSVTSSTSATTRTSGTLRGSSSGATVTNSRRRDLSPTATFDVPQSEATASVSRSAKATSSHGSGTLPLRSASSSIGSSASQKQLSASTTLHAPPSLSTSLNVSCTLFPSNSHAIVPPPPPTISTCLDASSTPFVLSAVAANATVVSSGIRTAIVVVASDSPHQRAVRSDGSSVVALTTRSVDRYVLMALPYLVLNLTIESPSPDLVVGWTVGNVVLGDATILNWSETRSPTSTPTASPWIVILIAPPPTIGSSPGSWLDRGVLLVQDTSLMLTITVLCSSSNEEVLVVKITVPAPGVARQLASQVKAAGGYSQIASVLAGGASSGSALGRVMAIRSMVLCDANTAVSGGVMDFALTLCGDSKGADAARSALVSNTVLILAAVVAILAVSREWATSTSTSFVSSTRIFSFPSSMLSVWMAVLPSSAASVTLLMARLSGSPCTATDVVLTILGIVIIAAPVMGFHTLWLLFARGPASRWVYTRGSITKSQIGVPHLRASARHWLAQLVHRVTQRRWKWRTRKMMDATRLQHEHDLADVAHSHQAAASVSAAWVVLLEYRELRYGGLDAGVVSAVSCLAVVSGLQKSGDSCVAWSAVVVFVLVLQVFVLVLVRPFTTIFSSVHSGLTLAMSCLSMAFQLWYLSSSLSAKGDEGTSSSSGGDQLWLVLASAICDLVVVGITAVKMLYDFKELVKAVRRRETTFHKLRDQRAAMAGGASFTVHGAEAIGRCHDGCSPLGALTPDGGVAPVPERLLLSAEDFEVFQETDARFWDDTGAARTTDEGRTPLGVGRLGPTLLIGEAATCDDDDDGAFV